MNKHTTDKREKKDYTLYRANYFFHLLTLFTLLFSLPTSAGLLEPTHLKSGQNDKDMTFQTDDPDTLQIKQLFKEFGSSLTDKNQAAILAKKGLKRIQNDDIDGGIADLTRAWELNPDLSAAGVAIAMAYLNKKNYPLALKTSKKLQKLYPEDPTGLTLEGLYYTAIQQHDKAKSALEKAFKKQPGDINSGLNLAKYAISDGDIQKAKQLYQKILEHHPNHAKVTILFAQLELNSNNIKQAIKILENNLKNQPESIEIREYLVRIFYSTHNYQKILSLTNNISQQEIHKQPSLLEFRGKAQFILQDYSTAINTYKKLITILPDSAPAHLMLAKAYFQNNNYDEALKITRQGIKIEPNFIPSRIFELELLQQKGQTKQAKQILKILLSNFKDNLQVLNAAGWLAMQQRQYKEATKYYRIIVKKHPNTVTTQKLYLSLMAQKHYNKAIGLLQNWLKQNPKDIKLLSLLADTYVALNREKEAIPVYNKLIKLSPELAQPYNNLALILQKQDINNSIRLAQKAQQLDPGNAKIEHTLGILLFKNAQFKKGLSHLKKASQLDPEDIEIQFQYATALLKLGHSSEAQSIFQKILKKDPTTPAGIKAKKILDML